MSLSAPLLRRARALVLPAVAAGATAAVMSVMSLAPATPPAPSSAPLGPAPDTVTGLQVESAAYTQAVASTAARTPKVTVIGTGGTISGVATSRSSFTDYRSGQIPIETMVGQLQPEIGEVARVRTVQFGNAGSGSYTIAQFRELTLAVERALRTSDGVVVTTGTDTMEEFAYWLDLTVQSREPVVLTGAMRPWAAGTPDGPQVLGADGPANLYNAISLAASQATYCFGSVLMLNDEFHAARDVTKTSTYRMDTFQTRELGVLGWIDGSEIEVGRAPARVAHCDRPRRWLTPFDVREVAADALPRVEIVQSYQEAGGEAITAFAEAGVEGIVTAGTGAGGISSAMSAARTAAAEDGVVFVSTSRTGSGSVHGGSEDLPIVAGEDLLPQKARLLLLLSLAFAADDDPDQVRAWVEAIGNPEWSTTSRTGAPPAVVTG